MPNEPSQTRKPVSGEHQASPLEAFLWIAIPIVIAVVVGALLWH